MALTEKENEEIIDIDLTPTRKKKIRINGDNTKIVELNTSDVGIIQRLSEAYPKLEELGKKGMVVDADFKAIQDAETDEESAEAMERAGATIKEIDTEMRKIIDDLFDSNVSEVCAPSGTMFDPFNGIMRFEYILEALIAAYGENITKEADKVKKNVSKHTKKYTGK